MKTSSKNPLIAIALCVVVYVMESWLIGYYELMAGIHLSVFTRIWLVICCMTPVVAYIELRKVRLHAQLFAAELFVSISIWCGVWRLAQQLGIVTQPLSESEHATKVWLAMAVSFCVLLWFGAIIAHRLLRAVGCESTAQRQK